jgi:hypothetical protein
MRSTKIGGRLCIGRARGRIERSARQEVGGEGMPIAGRARPPIQAGELAGYDLSRIACSSSVIG